MDDNLLHRIDSPADVRALSRAELPRLAAELREALLTGVSRTGGHLSSNLGTVELTVALHHVFDLPDDRLVWDVGHQSYVHKMLTGRRDRMATMRRLGGLSGFPRRDESGYDSFGTAHSSTSISAALGMALGARLKGERRRAIAVIGDGALSGGMALEALNNVADSDADLIVVLNDNDMSISPPTGALHRCLTRLMEGRFYAAGRRATSTRPRPSGGNVFEEFGFDYTGPLDGHDIDVLVAAFESARTRSGAQLIHVVTRKGCGYAPAERDPIAYHGPGPFDPSRGIVSTGAPGRMTFTQVFSDWICDMAERDPRVVAITPAMQEGSGLVAFAQRFPSRFHDVGIAEQHAVTFAAGHACEGAKPVVAIYSTFLQRAYDQLIHDVALQNLPVVFAIDRAGIAGADGATHAGAFDIAFLRCIPNMGVLVPSDEDECRQALYTACLHDGPVAVRYPRGTGPGRPIQQRMTPIPFGKGEVRRTSSQRAGSRCRLAILAFGTLLHEALKTAERMDATVANMRFVKPLDVGLVLALARDCDALVTIEDGCVAGGAGSAVAEALAVAGIAMPMLMLGYPDRFVQHGDPSELRAAWGLDAAGMEKSILDRFPELESTRHDTTFEVAVAVAVG